MRKSILALFQKRLSGKLDVLELSDKGSSVNSLFFNQVRDKLAVSYYDCINSGIRTLQPPHRSRVLDIFE